MGQGFYVIEYTIFQPIIPGLSSGSLTCIEFHNTGLKHLPVWFFERMKPFFRIRENKFFCTLNAQPA